MSGGGGRKPGSMWKGKGEEDRGKVKGGRQMGKLKREYRSQESE